MFDQKNLKKSQPMALNFKQSQFSKCVVLDMLNQSLTMTSESLRFFPDIASIFELQIVPTLEQLMLSKQVNSLLGVREFKLAILIITTLCSGFSLLR